MRERLRSPSGKSMVSSEYHEIGEMKRSFSEKGI
jgi:hypothetical protein